MNFLDLSFAEPAENLACDEALLELAESGGETPDCLRLWEAKTVFVVLGHSNRLAAHVNVDACRAEGIPILRRISGGGTVVQGPGCLNYSLTFKTETSRSIAEMYRHVLGRHRQLFSDLCGKRVQFQGISDLTIAGFKFSGNAQYRKARSVLVHGTFLLQFDLAVIDRVLPIPAEQPVYRDNRPHHAFLTNLQVERNSAAQALRHAWRAENQLSSIPIERIEQLARERYRDHFWSEKF